MSAAEQAESNGASVQAGPSTPTVARNPSDLRPSVSRAQTGPAISLIDHTSTYSAHDTEDEQEGSETPSPKEGLNRKLTKQSLQQSLAHRKYARYQEDRLFVPERREGDSGSEDDQGRMQMGKQWGKKKVKGLLKTKRQFQLAKKEDAAIDVLWENQRGWWAFGVPHFSSKSLLNFDPKPWLNGHRKASPVNITNAQVPDPDWEWSWKSWYVDMSRDVDEEGWEYSFAFSRGFAWHGNHPWGHSWVRRRRWLRKRVRKHIPHAEGRQAGKNMSEAHHLNADYFTIHPSNNLSRTNSLVPSTLLAKAKARAQEEYIEDAADVTDIGTLLVHLKRAALDREKIVLVRQFVENGGEDVYYLQEQMPKIMSLCVFQNSRRQLLSMLMDKCDAASRHRDHHESQGEAEGPLEKRRIDNLMRAIDAADQQVKKLEYWSDQRGLVCEGKAGTAPDDGQGWSHEWQGLDNSGPGSNDQTTAKEKGKSNEAVVKEDSHEQISPPVSGEEEREGSPEPEQDTDDDEREADETHDGDKPHDTEERARSEDQNNEPLKQVDPEKEQTLQPTGSHDQQHDSSSDAKYATADEDQKLLDAEAELDKSKDGFGALHETAEEDPRLVDEVRKVAKGKGRAVH